MGALGVLDPIPLLASGALGRRLVSRLPDRTP